MAAAVERVIEGEVDKAVSVECGIPYRTLKKYVGVRNNGESIMKSRRRPAPWLPAAAERDLYDWIVAMQREGSPVDRREILLKGKEIYFELTGGCLGDGWYRRFLERQPSLATRQTQVVARVRKEVDFASVDILFATISKLVIENKLSSCQLYNMDETAFQTRKKSKRVAVVKGSKCMWSKSVTTSFHLTIAACASASGHVIPPMFILSGERVDKRLLDECSVPDACVTCTPSGYMNRKLFAKWVQFFSESVPEGVSRPVVLVFDGYRSHYSPALVEMSMRLQVLLVYLPPNTTHLFQPLDISVFAPLKKLIRNLADDTAHRVGERTSCCSAQFRSLCSLFLPVAGKSTSDKSEAVAIDSRAWAASSVGKNCAAGFAATGIFPTSEAQMKKRVSLFLEGGGFPQKNEAEWLTRRQIIRTDILLLPARHSAPTLSRKTVDVGGRLLTAEMLQQTV